MFPSKKDKSRPIDDSRKRTSSTFTKVMAAVSGEKKLILIMEIKDIIIFFPEGPSNILCDEEVSDIVRLLYLLRNFKINKIGFEN